MSNTPLETIKILLVEDHKYTALGLIESLRDYPDILVLDTASTAAAGLQLAKELQPDIVLLDLHLPDGKSASELLLEFSAGSWRVVVFSGETKVAFIETALKRGAVAFLCKSDPVQVVVNCLKSVACGAPGPIVSPNLKEELFKLPPSLEEILKLLGKGLKYDDIAKIRHTTAGTVRQQCIALQERLGLASREQLIAWAVANGYASVD